MSKDQSLTAEQVAELLGVAMQSVHRWRRGRLMPLPTKRPGKPWLWNKDEVVKWAEGGGVAINDRREQLISLETPDLTIAVAGLGKEQEVMHKRQVLVEDAVSAVVVDLKQQRDRGDAHEQTTNLLKTGVGELADNQVAIVKNTKSDLKKLASSTDAALCKMGEGFSERMGRIEDGLMNAEKAITAQGHSILAMHSAVAEIAGAIKHYVRAQGFEDGPEVTRRLALVEQKARSASKT